MYGEPVMAENMNGGYVRFEDAKAALELLKGKKMKNRQHDELLETVILEVDAAALLQWVAKYYSPDEVFDTGTLSKWAEENGYEKNETYTAEQLAQIDKAAEMIRSKMKPLPQAD